MIRLVMVIILIIILPINVVFADENRLEKEIKNKQKGQVNDIIKDALKDTSQTLTDITCSSENQQSCEVSRQANLSIILILTVGAIFSVIVYVFNLFEWILSFISDLLQFISDLLSFFNK